MTFTITSVELISAAIGVFIGYKLKTPIQQAITSAKSGISNALKPKA